ncbi:TIGR01244 family sulfur transferase [Moraxella sp. ZJ142]|uniref:TIGR01244 family sulfur transferase n=1 Tax=Moraxella marmotae TaxID=3344520 RepID=UPI0035D4E9E3
MSELITVSGQISVDDVKALAEQGYKTLVNNRPDHEEPNQPLSDEIAHAAAEYGIEYCHIPFAGGMLEMHHVQAFADFYNSSERPLHLFCRSGNRSSIILQAAREQDLLDEE